MLRTAFSIVGGIATLSISLFAGSTGSRQFQYPTSPEVLVDPKWRRNIVRKVSDAKLYTGNDPAGCVAIMGRLPGGAVSSWLVPRESSELGELFLRLYSRRRQNALRNDDAATA